MKLITIIGARPQFIKSSSLSRRIKLLNDAGEKIEEIIVHTGQHFDENMSKIFFDEMAIPKPQYWLEIGGLSHGEMTGRMIEGLEKIIIINKPDWVVVFGDTNSTLAGSIAASKLNIKIAHIEAGLRSFNNQMPEEINRIVTDRLSTLLFCPTVNSMDNLESEGIEKWKNAKMIYSGDIMYESITFFKKISSPPIDFKDKKDFVLVTVHRAENTDKLENLLDITDALKHISNDQNVIFPIHPRTKKVIEENHIDLGKIEVIDPVGYLEMCWLIDNCSVVLTDSGGLQKEAYFLKKPCVTLRYETEWTELVDLGVNILTGHSKISIIDGFKKAKIISDELFTKQLYGEGNASEIILKEMINELKNE